MRHARQVAGMKLPGLPTFSALMLTAVLTAWLGLWGPMNFDSLKEWQTLLASCVAVLAASIAYIAAMAKVKLDRLIHEEARIRQRSAISLRLKFAAEDFRTIVERTSTKHQAAFVDSEIRFTEPEEFREAWSKLEDLPLKAANALNDIRRYLRVLRNLPPIKPTTMDQWAIEQDYDRQTASWVLPRLSRDLNVLIGEL
jgi:hypothetical protein